jgi:hypothetical protein
MYPSKKTRDGAQAPRYEEHLANVCRSARKGFSMISS